MTDVMPGRRRAVFLDRDGVLNVDKGYVHRVHDLELIPGVVEALVELKRRGFVLLMISNQSGVARGYFTLEDADRFNTALDAQLRARGGVGLDGVYVCPHHPDGFVPAFTQACACRKPRPGLILQAAREHGIDLQASFMVGDRPDDVRAALAAGVTPIQVVGTTHPGDPLAKAHVDSLKDALNHLT